MEFNRINKKWETVPASDGNWTIRVAGVDDPAAVVATVYGKALADTIVAEHNHFRGG